MEGLDSDKVQDVFIDFSQKDDGELKEILNALLKEEREISKRRRLLHGKIDLLRAELVKRKRERLQTGESIISDADIERLSSILVGMVEEKERKSEE